MCNHHRPVCVQCCIDMHPEKNGNLFIEDNGRGALYKLWATDKWKCPECGNQVLIGFPPDPISKIGDYDFNRQIAFALEDPHTIREKLSDTHD